MIIKLPDQSYDSSESSFAMSPISNASGDTSQHSLLPQDELRRRISRIRTDHSNGEDFVYPEISTHDGLNKWTSKLESALQQEGIPRSQWPDAAIIFMAGSGRINNEIRLLRERRKNTGIIAWSWEEFTHDVHELLTSMENEPSAIQRFQQENPIATTVAKATVGTGLVVAGSAILAPAAVVGALNAIGFTASGVAAHSVAAGIQSLFYAGGTTGLFSICQSIGATAVAASASSVVAATGSIAAGTTILRSGTKHEKQGPSNTGDGVAPPPYRR